MSDLEIKSDAFPPSYFVAALQKAYPIFAEKSENGHPKQQDADECYTSVLQSFREPLKKASEDDLDVIGNLFEIEMISTLKNSEFAEELETSTTEKVLKLSCHIDNNNNPISMLQAGIKISLEG